MREAIKTSAEEARRRGYSGEDIQLATFAVVAFLDESILNMHNPVFADWPRRPLQEEYFGHHVAGEIFFQNLDKILQRNDSQDMGDLLEVYQLCMLLGFAGKYSIGGRGELQARVQTTGDKIARIRQSSAELSPAWAAAERRSSGLGKGSVGEAAGLHDRRSAADYADAVRGLQDKSGVGCRPDGTDRVTGAELGVRRWHSFAQFVGVSLLAYMVAAWAAGKLLGLSESDFYILFAALIGDWRDRGRLSSCGGRCGSRSMRPILPADAPLDPNDEIDALVREAEAKLAALADGQGRDDRDASGRARHGRAGDGQDQHVLNSGLEPELLAGVAHQDNQVAPTRTANFWLAKNTIFAEAGAKLLGEQSRWVRLVRRLKPGSLKSMVGGNAQAPRAAVVCVNAEMFTQQGAAEYFATVATNGAGAAG